MFIGRKKELKYLNEAYMSDKAEFIILYGRRHVGKTEILNKFCFNKPCIFYTCRECTSKSQLEHFTRRIQSCHIPLFEFVDTFSDWEKAFSTISYIQTPNKKLMIIDEFNYAFKTNPNILSILQELWDKKLKNDNVMIILCISTMHLIENEFLSEKNPLHGRTTGIYKVAPLPYTDAIKFFPNYSKEDKLMTYSILGGMPYYLKQFSSELSLEENIKKNILRKGCPLYDEVEFLLKQELRETSVYNTIIEAIALGNNRFTDILNQTQIEKSKLSVYLKKLIEISIIDKGNPTLTSDKKNKSVSKGNYFLTDNFFRFWYAFVYKHLTDLENGNIEEFWSNYIKNNLNNFSTQNFKHC